MKNLNLNIGAFLKRRGTVMLLAGTLAVTCLTGCTKKADCEIPNKHAHMYVNDEGYIRYVESEKVEYEGYKRSYNHRDLTQEESQLSVFLDTKDLIRIDENIDLVLAQQEQNQPLTVYEYYVTTYSRAGSSTSYYWTNDPEHVCLTGKEKEVHYIYQAYKVEIEDGKYIVVPSELVEDITDVMEEFSYIREGFFIPVDEYNIDVKFNDDLAKKVQSADKELKKTID